MAVRQPAPGDLEPIETASRDEVQALQLQRLRWTLQHAYDNVPHHQRAFEFFHKTAPAKFKASDCTE